MAFCYSGSWTLAMTSSLFALVGVTLLSIAPTDPDVASDALAMLLIAASSAIFHAPATITAPLRRSGWLLSAHALLTNVCGLYLLAKNMDDSTVVTCAFASVVFEHAKPEELMLDNVDMDRVDRNLTSWRGVEMALLYHATLVHGSALLGCYNILANHAARVASSIEL